MPAIEKAYFSENYISGGFISAAYGNLVSFTMPGTVCPLLNTASCKRRPPINAAYGKGKLK